MKVDEIMGKRGPNLLPSDTDAQDLGFIAPLFKKAGYSEAGIAEVCGSYPLAFGEFPGYMWRCRKSKLTARARLISLFMLGEYLSVEAAAEVLGESLPVLLSRGLVKEKDGQVVSTVDIYPCEGVYVLTDHGVAVFNATNKVYELGADSYTMARMTPRRKLGKSLDLCAGSGIHAILAASHSDSVSAVEINERAIGFARVNAALNQVGSKCRFLQGDLYSVVGEEKFDLIVSNPPWIATPQESMQLYRWGGETGEAITQRIVEGLPKHLAVGGTLAMFVIYPHIRNSAYLDRLQSWLGGLSPSGGQGGSVQGWGVGLVDFLTFSLDSFVQTHAQGKWTWDEQIVEVARWLDMYQQHGIERMGTAVVYVRRLAEGAAGWTAYKKIPLPTRTLGPLVDSWLTAHERFNDPDWGSVRGFNYESWTPRLHDQVRHVFVDPRNGNGCVEGNAEWLQAVDLDKDEAIVVSELARARKTPSQLAAAWTVHKEFTEEAGRVHMRNMLRTLGKKQVIAPP